MFIITNHMTLLSFGLTPTEIETSDTVSPSRPLMNKSWSVSVSPVSPLIKPHHRDGEDRVCDQWGQEIKSATIKLNLWTQWWTACRLVVEQVSIYLLCSIFYRCQLFMNTHILSATAALTFSAVVRIRALSPFWLCEWDNLSVKERLAAQERRLKLSTDPSPRHNSTANVSVELVFMLHWMKVWVLHPDKQSPQ